MKEMGETNNKRSLTNHLSVFCHYILCFCPFDHQEMTTVLTQADMSHILTAALIMLHVY